MADEQKDIDRELRALLDISSDQMPDLPPQIDGEDVGGQGESKKDDGDGPRFVEDGGGDDDGGGSGETGNKAIIAELQLIRALIDDLPARMADEFGVNE